MPRPLSAQNQTRSGKTSRLSLHDGCLEQWLKIPPLMLEVLGSIPGPVKSDTMSSTAH